MSDVDGNADNIYDYPGKKADSEAWMYFGFNTSKYTYCNLRKKAYITKAPNCLFIQT